jgi:hypothetical protein
MSSPTVGNLSEAFVSHVQKTSAPARAPTAPTAPMTRAEVAFSPAAPPVLAFDAGLRVVETELPLVVGVEEADEPKILKELEIDQHSQLHTQNALMEGGTYP